MINLFNINNYTIDTSKFTNLLHDQVVTEFEQEFAEFVGAKYACSANSASSLIFLTMLISEQESVKIPSIMPPVVPNAILNAGKQIEFYDDIDWVGREYLLLEETNHNFMSENFKVWDSAQRVERNLFKRIANDEDLMIFSFYPTKPVGGCDGGMIVSNDKQKIDWYKVATFNGLSFSEHNWERKIIMSGWKMHINSIQAYIARENLRKLDSKQEALAEIKEIYNRKLGYTNTSDHLYRVRVRDNKEFTAKMKDRGIACGMHYKACHKQDAFRRWSDHFPSNPANYDPKLPKSEQEERCTVSLPFHENLTTKQVKKVIKNAEELASI